MLGDPARFAGGDTGAPNHVEQAGFAVIDVAHDGDDGWARDEQLRVFRLFRGCARGDGFGYAVGGRRGDDGCRWCRGAGRGALLANFEAQVRCDDGGGVVVERLIDRGNGAIGKQGLDDLRDRHAKNAGQVGHADDSRQLNQASLGSAGGGRVGGFSTPFKGFELTAAPAASLARTIRRA